MDITLLGGAKEVGRSAILLEDGKRRILLDYGVKINEETHPPLPVNGFVDAVIVSHAHLDHSGAVPLLFRSSECPVYMTEPTLPMVKLLVEDSIKVTRLRGLEQIFGKKHLKRMMRSTVKIEYGEFTDIFDWTFKFEDAGHILGSASTFLMNDYTILYTGDIKFSQTRIHNAAYSNFKNVDVLIMESTYGDTNHPDRKQLEKQFVEACEEKVEKGNNVIVPAFAVNRAQEIVEILYAHDFSYPVYMDGMSRKAAEIMLDYPNYIRDYKEFYGAMMWVNWVEDRERARIMDKQCVIVTTAGMLRGGPVWQYLLRAKKGDGLYFSGYQVEGTPGRMALEKGKVVYDEYNLDLRHLDIRYFDFSAHADRNELLAFAKKLKPPLVIVVHGEEEKANALKDGLEEEGIQALVPNKNERIKVEDYV